MTTLAEAAVDIVANTDGFDDELQDGITRAGASADRAARDTGRDLGQSIASAAQRSLSALGATLQRSLRSVGTTAARLGSSLGSSLGRGTTRALTPALNALGRFRDGFNDTQAAASAFSGYMGTLGGVARRALNPALNELGRFRDGFTNADAAASAFSGRMGTLGGVARRAMDGARTAITSAVAPLGRFRDGFTNADAAASAFSGRMGTLGGVARRALDGAASAAGTLREGLAGVRDRLAQATDGSNVFNSALGRMSALAAGVAAATGFAQLGSQILETASSAQTTRESLLALYQAAGAGAAEVNEVMDEMSTRFRGLDMTVMNEGITTLAYMGLQGEEAVDVLERLDMATTAAGTGATGLSRALDAMTKGVNAGKFQMGELGQISNAGIPIYDALSDVLGVSIPEAQKMASAGAIGLADVLEAMSGEAGVWFPALMEGAENVGKTLAGSWSTIQSSFVNGFAFQLLPVLDRLAPVLSTTSDLITRAFDALPGLVDDVTGALSDSGVWDTFRSILDGIGRVLLALRPLLGGFASGLRSAGGTVLTLLGYLRPAGGALESLAGFLERNADLLRILGTALGGAVAGLALYRAAALTATLASRLLAGGVRGIGAAIRGVPLIGWVLAAIGVLITLYQTSDRFREIVNNAFTRVREAVQAAWDYIRPVWNTMVDRLGALWGAVTGWQGWRQAWESVQDVVSAAWDVISGVWGALTQGWGKLTSAFSGGGSVSWWSSLWEGLSGAVSVAWGVLSTTFEQITDAWRLLARLLSGDAGWGDVGEFLADSFGRLREVGALVGGWLLDQLRELPGKALRALAGLGSALWGWFSGLPGRLWDAVGGPSGVLSWLQGVGELAAERLRSLGGTVVTRIKAIPGQVKDQIDPGAIVEWLRGAGTHAIEHLQGLGQTILTWVTGLPGRIADQLASTAVGDWLGLGALFEKVGDAWGLLSDLVSGDADFGDVGQALLGAFGGLRGIGETAAGWIIDQLRQIPSKALDALSGLSGIGGRIAGWIIDQLKTVPSRALEALEGLKGIGGRIAGWFIERLEELPGKALGALSGLGETVSGWFSGLPDRVSDSVGGPSGILSWLQGVGELAGERLRGLGETIVERIKALPDTIRDNVDPGAILEWLREVPGRITDFMRDYGPKILKGLAIAIGVVVLGVPALLLGLLAAILTVLGVIAWELLKWAWGAFTDMMAAAGRAVASGISSLVGWFASLPGRALGAIADFGARLASWGLGAMSSLRSSLSNGMNTLRSWWNTAWSGVFSTVRGWWNTFVSWVAGAAVRLRDRVMTPVDKLKDRMIGAFDSARTGIREAWNGLRRAVGTPINWVIDTAYTRGIKNIWDRVVGKFGGDKLPDAPATLKFRAGGVFPGYTPGRDIHRVPMAAFSGGESVLRPEVTRAWGAKTTLMLNKLARAGGVPAVRRALQMLFSGQNPFTGRSVPTSSGMNPGGGFAARFQQGGIMGSAGRAWSWLTSKTEDFAEGMMDFLDDPKGMFERLVNALVDWSSIPGAGLAVGKTLVGLPKKLLKELAQAIKDMFTLDGDTDWSKVGGSVGGRLGAALAFARAQAGKPYIWGGVGPRGYDCSGFTSAITNVILGRSPYSRRHTTHGFRGMTHDGFRRNFASPWMIGVTHAGVGHMSGTLMGTNVESRGSAGVVIGPRARGYNNGLYSWRGGLMAARGGSGGDRMGGEGIAFDSGGLLPRGWTLTYNGTRHPETVRTYAQERRVEDLVRLVQAHHSRLAPALARSGPGGGVAAPVLGNTTTVNAPVTVHTLAADPETVAYKTAARIARLAGL